MCEPYPNDYLDEMRDAIVNRRRLNDDAYYRENAYRRGYHQGYYAALCALLDGGSAAELEAFAMEGLFAWRNRRHDAGQEPPPKFRVDDAS